MNMMDAEKNNELTAEIWLPVVGAEKTHQVSNLGRIKSLARRGKNRRIFEKILKPSITPKGYYRISLCSGKIVVQGLVHRFVAKSFIPNPKNKPHIHHKNFIRNDNRVENLEWATVDENNAHSFPTVYAGLISPVHMISHSGCIIRTYECIKEAKEELRVNHIGKVCMGKAHTSGGVRWRYAT